MMKEEVKLKQKIILISGIVVIVLIVFLGIKKYQAYQRAHQPFLDSIQVEINSEFDPEAAINNIPENKQSDIQVEGDVDTAALGTYPVTYIYNDHEYQCKINVVDTTAPVFTVKEVTVRLNQEPYDANSFIDTFEDATTLTYSFVDEKEIEEPGDYTVMIRATDESGNYSDQEAVLHVLEPDMEAPVLTGLGDMSVKMNSEVNYYSNVYITDNIDTCPSYTVDHSAVNLSTPGTYTAVYTATDKYGNSAAYNRNIIVSNESSPTSRVIYLTFDDGPSKNTQSILDILNKYGIKATFFVTGNNPAYYNYLRIENDSGNSVAIHTFSHDYPTIYASADAYKQDFYQAQNLIRTYLGYDCTIFRFPGGSSNHESMKYCEGIITELAQWANDSGYTYVDWNVISGDGNVATPVDEMISTIEKSPQYDQICLLCHDSGAATNTVKALPTIIEYYLARGYTFKIITDSTMEFHHNIAN